MLDHRVAQRIKCLHLQVVTQIIAGTEPFLPNGRVKDLTGRELRNGQIEAGLEFPELQTAPPGDCVGGFGGVDPHGLAIACPGLERADLTDVVTRDPIRQDLHFVVELLLRLGKGLGVSDGRVVGDLSADGRIAGAEGARGFYTHEFGQFDKVVIGGRGGTRIHHGPGREAASAGVTDPFQAIISEIKLPIRKDFRYWYCWISRVIKLHHENPVFFGKSLGPRISLDCQIRVAVDVRTDQFPPIHITVGQADRGDAGSPWSKPAPQSFCTDGG